MPTPIPRPTHDRWCDSEGAYVPLFSQAEQVADSLEPGTLPSRLHQQDRVLGRTLDSLYVRFDDNTVVSLSPRLPCLIPDTPGEC